MPEIYLGLHIQLTQTEIMQICQSINAKQKLSSSYTSFNLGKDTGVQEMFHLLPNKGQITTLNGLPHHKLQHF